MTTVNALIPALLAGNAVIIKPSPRTPLCGNHFVETFEQAGVPLGLVTALHSSHEIVADVIRRPEIGFVSFTGSVYG